MAALTQKFVKLGVLGVGALGLSVAALTSGVGTAGANPNDPGMDNVRPDGTVNSRQAASTAGSKYCEVGTGTLTTASTHTPEMGTPKQTAQEAGPSWVGSNGWQAIGLSPSNPWGGNFNPRNTRTGPQCRKGNANGF